MNLLTDRLPLKAKIEDKEYPLNTDFRNVITYFKALKDNDLDAAGRLELLLKLFFKKVPADMLSAVKYIFEYYLPGGSPLKTKKKKVQKNRVIPFCYEKDHALIYAAFRQQYGIDLNGIGMHWFTFKALFDGLAEQTYFRQVVNFRQTPIKDIPKEKRREFLEAMEDLKIIEVNSEETKRSAVEIEKEVTERFKNGRRA